MIYGMFFKIQEGTEEGLSFELKIDKNECYKFDYKKFNYLGLSAGIHQIDYYNGVLYATDTYNNRLIIFKDNEKEYFYPNGKLKDGGGL